MPHFLSMFFAKLAADKVTQKYLQDQKENDSILKPPGIISALGIFSMVFWGAFLAAVFIFAESLAAKIIGAIVFGTLFALGLFLFLYARNFMMVYREHTIIRRNILGVTRVFPCSEISSAFYTNSGGIQLLFQNGKKLAFGKEETVFCQNILQNEHLNCRFKGEEQAVIRVFLHPFFTVFLWILSASALIASFFSPNLLFALFFLLPFCLGCQFSSTVYDTKSKILTRRKFGFKKQYNLKTCSAVPVYKNGFLMRIDLYQNSRRTVKIPLSAEYRNRARLAKALCGITS